jgi:alkyl hydroperoxide reductase subunit AhpF
VTPLGQRERAAVSELWDGLERAVDVRLDLGPVSTPVALIAAGGREIDTNAETRSLVEQLCELSTQVRLEVTEHDGAGTYPTLTVGDGLRFVGLPWGYELATVVHGVADAGRTSSTLTEESLARLAGIEQPVAVDVFVTPT